MMKSKTFTLFIVAVGLDVASILTSMFWNHRTMGNNNFLLGVIVSIAFGFSIAGIIVGFSEIKTPWKIVGMAGNCLIVVLYAALIGYGLYLKS